MHLLYVNLLKNACKNFPQLERLFDLQEKKAIP